MPSLVLVGGGHAHVEVLRRLAARPCPALTKLTLVSPGPTSPYSGMLPGVVEGLYRPADGLIDVAALAAAVPGGEVVLGRAAAVDTAAREVVVEVGGGDDDGGGCPPSRSRRRLPYDVLSLDVGAAPGWGGVPGAAEWAVPLRPVAGLVARVEAALLGAGAGVGPPPAALAVVGGGAAGVELAAALAVRLAGERSSPARLTLVCGGALLPGAPPAAVAAVSRRLEGLGVAVLPAARVLRVEPGDGGGTSVVLTLGSKGATEATTRLAASACLWATGAAAQPWLAAGPAPPPLSPDGFLSVAASLACSDDPASPLARVFGAGDCISLPSFPDLPKAGVFAVRQGPALEAALRASLEGGPRPPPWRPQAGPTATALLALGRRTAVGVIPVSAGGKNRARLVVEGGWVWWLKHAIDSRFVGRYRLKA